MDLIDRQAAIEALKAMAVPLYKDPACEDIWERDRTLDNAIDAMRGLPSVQPERKKGHWIEVIDEIDSLGNKTWHNECSICGNGDSGWGTYRWCPVCGAKMEGEQDG